MRFPTQISVGLLVVLLRCLNLCISDAASSGGNSLAHPSRSVGDVLFTFRNDDVEWDPELNLRRGEDMKGRRPPVPNVVMEVRRVPVPKTSLTMRGVFIKQGKFSAGHLVGCYTGALVDTDKPEVDQRIRRFRSIEAYLFGWSTKLSIDPSDHQGDMPDTLAGYTRDEEGKPRSMMPLVNEPGAGQLPNIVVGDRGGCKDRKGIREGKPLYAFRDIRPGDELVFCYGLGYRDRPYATVCSDEEFYDEYLTWARDLVEVIVSPSDDPRQDDVPPAHVLEKMIAEYQVAEEDDDDGPL